MMHLVHSLLAITAFCVCASAEPADDVGQALQSLHEDGCWAPGTTAWIGDGTRSQRVAEGLLVADDSTEAGSGRFYMVNWGAAPQRGAALHARAKVTSCSASWGVCMMVADGVHEECLTIFPARLQLENAKLTVDFDAASDFHTYRLAIQGTDVRVEVDGKLILDAAGKFTTPAQSSPPRNQCGFGSGASAAMGEAVWQWVRYTGTPADASAGQLLAPGDTEPGRALERNHDLRIAIGQTVDIVPGATYTSLFKFRDGRLSVGDTLSHDAGKTWTTGPGVGTGAFEFADGEIISPGFVTKRISDGVFEIPLSRSTDGGKSFVAETARLNIPEATGGTGDDGKFYEGPPVDHAIVQLRDGSLLMAMYGYFMNDTVLCPAFPPEWKLYKYRTWVMRSTDRGRTWDLWTTVAYDPAVGCESFCEADLLTLPAGDILCFMRTGGNPPKYTTPLYMSTSQDDGKSWSKPVPIADRGVWPNACRMQSGVLVVTYGRPDNWLAFSLDNGKSWTGHLCFYRGATTSYNTVEEVAPGTLLVVYDKAGLDADGNQASGVVGTFVHVDRIRN